jgi:hypothetical protein
VAQSIVDICNSALQRVGAATILSLSDNSREARACSVQYDSNRRDELRRHAWNFAIKRTTLAPDVTAPTFEFTYAFTLPSDCLRVILPSDSTLDWVIEGRKILTNSVNSPATLSTTSTTGALGLRYVADIEDVSQFDPAFYSILAISLAIDLCEVLTTSNQKKNALNEEYKQGIREARGIDAIEKLPGTSPDDGLILARI